MQKRVYFRAPLSDSPNHGNPRPPSPTDLPSPLSSHFSPLRDQLLEASVTRASTSFPSSPTPWPL